MAGLKHQKHTCQDDIPVIHLLTSVLIYDIVEILTICLNYEICVL